MAISVLPNTQTIQRLYSLIPTVQLCFVVRSSLRIFLTNHHPFIYVIGKPSFKDVRTTAQVLNCLTFAWEIPRGAKVVPGYSLTTRLHLFSSTSSWLMCEVISNSGQWHQLTATVWWDGCELVHATIRRHVHPYISCRCWVIIFCRHGCIFLSNLRCHCLQLMCSVGFWQVISFIYFYIRKNLHCTSPSPPTLIFWIRLTDSENVLYKSGYCDDICVAFVLQPLKVTADGHFNRFFFFTFFLAC